MSAPTGTNKLLITTDHRRDPDLARTAPLTLPVHSEPMHRTDTETRTNRIVPGSDETHRNATGPSNPCLFFLFLFPRRCPHHLGNGFSLSE
jgi:hypothetical protein